MRYASKVLTFGTLIAISNIKAIEPDFIVSIFGGLAKTTVKMNDPFKTEANAEFYHEYDAKEAEKSSKKSNEQPNTSAANSAIAGHAPPGVKNLAANTPNFNASSNTKKTEQSESTKSSPLEKKDGYGSYTAQGQFYAAALNIEVKKDMYYIGLNIGALFDLSQPTFKSLIHYPSIEEQIETTENQIEEVKKEKHETPPPSETASDDHPLKARHKFLHEKHEKLDKKKDELRTTQKHFEKEKIPDQSKDVHHTIMVNKGPMIFIGPYGGIYLSENLKISLDLNITGKRTKVTMTTDNESKTDTFGIDIGIMPNIRLHWLLNERTSIFISAGIVMFPDWTKLPIKTKDDKAKPKSPTDEKDKKHAENQDPKSNETDEFKGKNQTMILLSAGITFMVN